MALRLGGPQEINGWAGPQEIQNSGNQIFEIKGKAGPQEIIWLGGNQWLGHRESMARPQAKNGGQWAMARWAWLAAWLGGPRSPRSPDNQTLRPRLGPRNSMTGDELICMTGLQDIDGWAPETNRHQEFSGWGPGDQEINGLAP